ncbi:hypothetical protein UFOVP99_34 [uncultured Caudovirales phage]|uniref:Uncharacterized protein n=1 Tax=uncultured Caudovirales phage TaxID=2100421 RepID=A0A6J5L5H6_9CAUD|nr:hypothetical protein UFOVP99_34 [uncultured Caudovirales phage]
MRGRAWWSLPLGDWPHVWIARAEPDHRTLVLNSTGTVLQAFSIAYPLETYVAALRGIEVPPRIMYLPPWPQREAAAGLRWPLTCVGVVKAALGIDAPFVQTPAALARHLAARGGTFEET